jgi:hypothetical protein
MKKTIYLMAKTLEKHHLEDCIPYNEWKNPSLERGNGHALIFISSSHNAWVLDLRATHHLDSSDILFSYLETCFGPPIFMGDDSPAKVCDRGRVDIEHGLFHDLIHVPNISMNLLSIYTITHLGLGKKVELTPNLVFISDLSDG